MAEDLSDLEVISAIRNGHTRIFQQVFDSCYESLCRYAFSMLRDMDEAEDTVQSLFVKLWERRESLELRSSIRSYLFRSVYNQSMNILDHKAIKRKHQEDSQNNKALGIQQPDVFPSELDDQIKQAVNKLPPQCRTIFLLSRYEELRHDEIAEKLNISVNTIQNQICKALKVLRSELKDITI